MNNVKEIKKKKNPKKLSETVKYICILSILKIIQINRNLSIVVINLTLHRMDMFL